MVFSTRMTVRGRSGVVFALAVWGLLLGLTQAQDNGTCATVEHVDPVSPEDPKTAETLGTEFISPFVQSFLHTVQPNPFPESLILEAVQNVQNMLGNSDTVHEALYYEIGFLVCVAIGVLYIILMPIIGFFLACCRCCGNCGGRMEQKQTSSTKRHRRTLYFFTLITTIIILVGNICMFRSNQFLKESVDKSVPGITTIIGNLNNFLTSVSQQIQHVADESSRTVDEVTKNLDDIGPLLGMQVQQKFDRALEPAFNSVRDLDTETKETSSKLQQLNTSLVQLQTSLDEVQVSFTDVKSRMDQTLSKAECVNCDTLRDDLQRLTLDTTVNVPGLAGLQSEVDAVIEIDLLSKIKEVEDILRSIPERITNQTQDLVRDSKQQLQQIKAQISKLTGDISSPLSSVSKPLNEAQAQVDRISPELERAEHIRWAICLALCCVVLLVVVYYFLGLMLGPLGLNQRSDPTERSGTANCGGTFFMMGAGISFLFSWLFMIVVVVLFVVGGNVYTLLCQPWRNGELLRIVDTSGVIPTDMGSVNGVPIKLSLTGIYRDCGHNEPLWTVLDLSKSIDLDDLLNVSKYTEQIQQQFDRTNFDMPAITILSADFENQLNSFSDMAKTFNFTAATQQINGILNINLNTTADVIDAFAANQPDTMIQTELTNEASALRQIQANIETTIFPQVEMLNLLTRSLQSLVGEINGTVGEVQRNVQAAQAFLDNEASKVFKTEGQRFLDCQLGYFTAYADWAKSVITRRVGQCLPVASALDSAHIIFCSNMVESLNAFWFSLGWCLIFFIPGIIFSIKLAKYYRRMKHSDSPFAIDSRNQVMMNHIPRAQMKIT